jgi:pyrroline-5-carboxylate reductase
MLDGWLDSGVAGAGVAVVDPVFDSRPMRLAGHGEVKTYASPADLPDALEPEVVVFAIKPQQMAETVPAFTRYVTPETVFLSIAAGTPIAFFEQQLGPDAAVVRAMPNTPAALRLGISVACPNARVASRQLNTCTALLKAIGEVRVIEDEGLLNAVTAVSGSGPAYLFLLIDCLAKAGEAVGLPSELAARLALVTVSGSGQLAINSDASPAQLRRDVAAPGGTTEAALKVLMADDGLDTLIRRAVEAATKRSRELAT